MLVLVSLLLRREVTNTTLVNPYLDVDDNVGFPSTGGGHNPLCSPIFSMWIIVLVLTFLLLLRELTQLTLFSAMLTRIRILVLVLVL